MSLEEYRRKRRPGATPEPGTAPRQPATPGESPAGRRFVIQQHDATRLHYDLRLEHDGVLKSWALPKGLATPHDNRKLAVQVEDHPLEYLEFEGEIPAGEYGAGQVVIWDTGVYEPLEEPGKAIGQGKLTFRLRGGRIDGEFSLVRMKGKAAADKAGREGKNWLVLLHKTGRLNTDLMTAGRASNVPPAIVPMQAVLGGQPFSSPEYIYEIKYDGVRAVAYLRADGELSLKSRNGRELLPRFPELSDLAASFLAEEMIADGEIVAQDVRGVSHFQLLQGRIGLAGEEAIGRAAISTPAFYYIFDLLYLNGRDLTGLPLIERKEILSRIFMPQRHIRMTEWIPGEGEAFFQAAQANGLEGIMAKATGSPYRQKRSGDWVKLKAVRQQEFVVGGYTRPRKGRAGFGALLVGYYEAGRLVYAGHVGSGFSEEALARLMEAMQPLKVKDSPFSATPKTNEPAHWIRPELVAEVKFSEWTQEGNLRQPVFLGLRSDKDPREIRREEPPPDWMAPPEASAGPAEPEYAAPAEEATSRRPQVNPALPPLSGERQEITVEGHRLALSHLDKEFWPAEGYRKFDLINYYHRVAQFILPHLQGRPLTLKRYPDGYGSKPFFQKEAPQETPQWIHTEVIPSEGGHRSEVRYIVCDDLPTLYFLANLACISQNPWLSAYPRLENPDYIIFDLDPLDAGDFDACIEIALLVREHLAEFGLKGFPKTSGATGIHVYVPIRPVYSFEQARQFAQIIAWLCHEERPDIITLESSLARREGKVYLDCLQNVEGKTVASVYSVRAQAGAPVSTPLEWSEMIPGSFRPRDFNIANLPGRLEEKGDLFGGVLRERQDLMLALKQGEKYLRAG